MNTSEELNRIAAITSAQSEVAAYNNDLDRYVTGDLLKKYAAAGISVIDGRISGGNVLRAAEIYYKSVRDEFEARAYDIILDMHARGFDVRMDMQSYKLVWKGVYKNA